MADRMSPERRAARARRLADAYHKRVGERLAEPREEFLQRHADLRDVLEPLVERTQTDRGRPRLSPVEPEVPEQIGPYRVLGVLGEGGMGTVYVAEQKQPFRRRVALKVIKLGMDSKEVLLRFEAERQALAMMEHDNIARVFDAGTTERGQPYFAMEYVKGEPFTKYCDDQSLGLEARLELFCQVCAGVQHAHMKGVIHRDLTPRNVLVTVQDGKATPKIIDFGIARATDHRLLEKTIFTQQGKIMGVPEYMSPEQAGLGALDIDTRSDVYTLGVLLYETLIGQLPFSALELRSAGLMEMERKIREDDPPRPSTRMTGTPGRNTADVARLRGLDRTGLVRKLKGDLDWVTMKALEKDRTRRYQTASELVQDIERYVRNEPVLARPPTLGYRARKYLRRHRVQAVAGALVVVAVLAGTASSLLFAFRASANAERAEYQLARAEELTGYLLDELPDGLRKVGRLELLRDVAYTVVAHYDGLQDELLSDQGRYKAARGLDHVGRVLLDLGDLGRSQSALTRASGILEGLLAGDQRSPHAARELARSRLFTGVVYRDRGALDLALSEHRRAQEILQQVSEEEPDDLDALGLLALTHDEISRELRQQGSSVRALAESEIARDLRAELAGREPDNDLFQADLARSHHNVGQILHTQGHLERARFAYSAALGIRRHSWELDPRSAIWKEDLASSYADLGRALHDQGHDERARESYLEALELRKRLAEDDPENATWQDDLAGTYLRLGLFAANETELEQALASQRAALRIRQELTEQDRSNATWRSDLADSHHGVGVTLQRQGSPGALESYRSALKIREDLVKLDPGNAQWQGSLAKEHNNIGTVLQAEGDYDGALQSYGKALEIELRLQALDPADATWKREVAGSHENIGEVSRARGQPDAALASLRSAVALREDLASLDDSNARFRQELANSYGQLANVLYMQDRTAGDAVESLSKALAIREDLVGRHPESARLKRDLANSFHAVGVILGVRGDHDGALRSWEKVVEIRAGLVAGDPDNTTLRRALATALANVSNGYQQRGSLTDALASWKESLEVYEDPEVRGRIVSLASAFSRALEEPGFRSDLTGGNLYHAARAAALAARSGDRTVADIWLGQALEWLEEDLRLRRERSGEIQEELRSADPLSEAAAELRRELRMHTDHLEEVRTTDPDLAGLRGMPGFAALFR